MRLDESISRDDKPLRAAEQETMEREDGGHLRSRLLRMILENEAQRKPQTPPHVHPSDKQA